MMHEGVGWGHKLAVAWSGGMQHAALSVRRREEGEVKEMKRMLRMKCNQFMYLIISFLILCEG